MFGGSGRALEESMLKLLNLLNLLEMDVGGVVGAE